MLKDINLNRVLFFDIETVPLVPDLNSLTEPLRNIWNEKTEGQIPENITPDEYWKDRAGLASEFLKVVCISVGYLRGSEPGVLRTKSFYGHDEKKLLQEFAGLLSSHYNSPNDSLCGHNIKGFDLPVLCRRMIINGIELPAALDLYGRKPWEINHVDTMELWRFGDFRYFVSLKLLCAALGIPSPKDDIDGSQVGSIYYETGDVERIARYCEKDVKACADVLMAMLGRPLPE